MCYDAGMATWIEHRTAIINNWPTWVAPIRELDIPYLWPPEFWKLSGVIRRFPLALEAAQRIAQDWRKQLTWLSNLARAEINIWPFGITVERLFPIVVLALNSEYVNMVLTPPFTVFYQGVEENYLPFMDWNVELLINPEIFRQAQLLVGRPVGDLSPRDLYLVKLSKLPTRALVALDYFLERGTAHPDFIQDLCAICKCPYGEHSNYEKNRESNYPGGGELCPGQPWPGDPDWREHAGYNRWTIARPT